MPRPDLVADCARCAALCCTWIAFDASPAFAFSKPAGVSCHLLRGDRCSIHRQREARGLGGCAAYDCHGAGQRATALFAAASLDDQQRHDLFAIVRDVHDLLWRLAGAADLCPSAELRAELAGAIDALDALARGSAASLLAADLAPHHARATGLLRRLRALLAPAR